MNARALKILGSAVAVLLIVFLLVELRGNEEPATSGERMFPHLRAQIENIDSIEVLRADFDEPVKLLRSGDRWAVGNRNDYPADFTKIRELLQALADARIIEIKTARPELHHRLGLQSPDVAGSKGTQISLSGNNLSFVVIVGNTARGNLTYIRNASEDQTWLIDQNPTLPATANEWLLTDLVNLKSAEVVEVSIMHTGGDTILISRAPEDEAQFVVADIPQGRELSNATVANNIAGALSDLSFDDIRPANENVISTETVFTTAAGLKVTITSFSAEDDNWISLHATTVGDADEPAVQAAAAINARVDGWQYQVADHKFNLLNRQWTDILKTPAEIE